MPKPVRRAWNGGSPDAAKAAADKRRDAAAATLRAAYQQAAALDPWRCTAPFTHTDASGWVYLPVEDCVILAETAQQLREMRSETDPHAPCPSCGRPWTVAFGGTCKMGGCPMGADL
jgi:hypothetical protein